MSENQEPESSDVRPRVYVTAGGYIDSLGRGRASSYLRMAVDEHLSDMRRRLAMVAQGRTDDEIVELIAAADLPLHRARRETDYCTLSAAQQDALADLAAEVEATGLDPAKVLELLRREIGA